MKKFSLKKALFVALASALVIGQAATVMAAEEKVQTADSAVVATTVEPEISNFSAGSSLVVKSSTLYISASGYGDKAEIIINGVTARTVYGTGSDKSFSTAYSLGGIAGAYYTITLKVTGSDGDSIATRTVNRRFKTPAFSTTYKPYAYTYSKLNDNGYYQVEGVVLNFSLDSFIDSTVKYKLYRKEPGASEYTFLYEGSSNYISSISITDTTVKPGKVYYYKLQLVGGTDAYVQAAPVIATSAAVKAQIDFGQADIDLTRVSGGVKIGISSSDYCTSFDIYRSATKVGGYKKIKTVYSREYVDKSVKAGAVYYYKVVPKYYDVKQAKYYSGVTSSPKGIQVLVGNPNLSVTQTANTSLKLTWDKVVGVNTYEVWMRNWNISGDVYRKVDTTTGTSYTATGLSADGDYGFLLKCQNKSNGKVLYEVTTSVRKSLTYSGYLYDARVVAVKSAVSADKQNIAIYNKLVWSRVAGASGYIITGYNRITGQMERITKITNPATTTYTVKNPGNKEKGIKYQYVKVEPYKGTEIGSGSSYIYVNRLPFATNVKAVRANNSTSKITWSAVPGADSYHVYRVNKSSYNHKFVESTSSTSAVDTYFSTKTYYRYHVVALSDFAGVDYTSSDVIYTESAKYTANYVHKIGTPKIGKAVNSAAGTIDVSWYAVAGAKGYRIYRSTSKTGKYVQVGTSTTTKFADKKATKGQTYYYKVAAVAVADNGIKSLSAYSGIVYAKSAK